MIFLSVFESGGYRLPSVLINHLIFHYLCNTSIFNRESICVFKMLLVLKLWIHAWLLILTTTIILLFAWHLRSLFSEIRSQIVFLAIISKYYTSRTLQVRVF